MTQEPHIHWFFVIKATDLNVNNKYHALIYLKMLAILVIQTCNYVNYKGEIHMKRIMQSLLRLQSL